MASRDARISPVERQQEEMKENKKSKRSIFQRIARNFFQKRKTEHEIRVAIDQLDSGYRGCSACRQQSHGI